MQTDEQLIAEHIAKHGVTRIENGQWPYADVTSWTTQITGQVEAARKRGTKAMMDTRKREFNARMDRILNLADQGYTIEQLAALEKVSRNRMVELFRIGGRPMGSSRKEKTNA
jgi:hypothetical protein